MAEPLILAYGRGELPEFPAAVDTIVDIVPVDQVVAALVAVLAHPPAAGAPAYFHVTSGDRNPLTFGVLYTVVRGYFEQHPFAIGDRGAARLPEWRFPGAPAVERLLSTSERAHRAADYVLGHAPRSDRVRDLARRLDQQGRRLAFLRRYLDLYHEYAQAELRFSDAATFALWQSLDPADRERFAFDTAAIDWPVYLARHPLPGGDRAGARDGRAARRARTPDHRRRPRRGRGTRHRRVLRHGRHAAVLQRHRDLPVDAAARARTRRPVRRAGPDRAARCPHWCRPTGASAATSCARSTASTPGRASPTSSRSWTRSWPATSSPRLSPAAVRRIRQHRAAGQRTVLHHRCDRAADAAARPALRPHRGRASSPSTSAACAPDTSPARRWWGSRGPPSCAPGRPRTTWTWRRPSPTPTATPTCRCSPRWATRSPYAPTWRCSATPAATAGRWSTGPARRPRGARSTPPAGGGGAR